MQVRVDPETCIGCGSCVDVCPDIFEMAGDLAITKTRQVAAHLQDRCREAAEACPVDAIILE